MANISKIKLSGTTYTLKDSNATQVIDVTQAQYEALEQAGTLDPTALYNITDATPVSLEDYYTSAQTEAAIESATSGKTDTSAFTAHTADSIVHVTSADKTAWNGAVSDVATVSAATAAKASATDLQTLSGKVDTNEEVVSRALNVLNTNKLDVSAYTPTDLSDYYTSAQTESAITSATSGKTDTSAFTAHTADSTVHVTSQDKSNWNAKSDFSGSYTDLTDKPTIPTSASQLTNDAGYITSDAISGKTDTSAFTAHTADSVIHVSSADKTAWNGAVSDVATVSASTAANTTALGGLKLVQITQNAYDQLGTKDASTLYVIVN